MRRAMTWAVAIATTIGIALVTPAGAQVSSQAQMSGAAQAASSAAYCGIGWGSLDKSGRGHGPGLLRNIRAGQHTCYDRLVFDIADGAAGYQARYVPGVTAEATGDPVPLRGGAFLQIIFYVPLSDQSEIGYTPANRSEVVDVSGWRTFRQVADAGQFEGQVTIGLGVRARLPFRVFTLDGPGDTSRLVVDVAHRW